MTAPLVLLGCGYTLTRLALREAAAGRTVLATTRDEARRAVLEAAGVQVLPLEAALAQTWDAEVVHGVPPEAGLDARIAEALREGPPVQSVYLSSTGVYGAARGVVDEETPVDAAAGAGRLAAEALLRPLGTVVLRVAGIYGPGRGAHTRLLAGQQRLPEGGGGRISRVHVEDLVAAVHCVLGKGTPGAVYCVADERPASQGETIRWLCERLGVALPPEVPLGDLHASLRGDRAVQNAKLKALGWQPRYPSYREGFDAVLAEEGR
jgi:nucleoside-diphosphate-sugar epimerase